MSIPPHPPTLTTDGEVLLRAHHPDDAPRSFEATLDPEYQRWTSVPLPPTLEGARAFVGEMLPAAWADGSSYAFAVEYDGRYAGTLELRPDSDRAAGVAEVAYGSHPDVRGAGVMERALRLLVTWGFESAGLHTIMWRAHRGNWASRRLAWKVGFRVEGTVRQWVTQRGTRHDAWVGTLLREDPREPTTPWLRAPDLSGDGVRLRAFTEADVPRIVEACSDPRTQQWLGGLPDPYTEDDAREYLLGLEERHARNGGVTWAVTADGSDAVVGAMGLFDYTPGESCEIGYWAHPSARGRGVTTAAGRVVLRYAFGGLGVRRVTGFAAVDNRASRHVLGQLGLREYGVERLGGVVRGGRADQACLDVLASEWLADQAALVSRAVGDGSEPGAQPGR